MNKERRSMINKAAEMISVALGILEEAAEAERDACANLPESLQSGDQGVAMESAAEALDQAVTACEEAIRQCEEAAA